MPSSNVVIDVSVVDPTEVSVATTALTFTPTNWNSPQNISISGIDDAIRDGDIISDLIFSVRDIDSDDDFDALADQLIQVRNQDNDPESCLSRNFDEEDIIFIQDATHTSGSMLYQLTPNLNNQRGMIWYQNRLDLRVEFAISARLNFGNRDAGGADGIAFVIQNINTSQGSSGGGMGYQGISPSYAIEMDTYYNFTPDPNSDHIAFVQDGAANSPPVSGDIVTTVNLEDGNWHNIRIQWQPTSNELSYVFTHANGTVYTDSKEIDLINSVFGTDIAYFGFTAATGGSRNNQSVEFSNTSFCLADEILMPTATNEILGTSTQIICATPIPTLRDLVRSDSRPEGINPQTNINNIPFSLVWFTAATGGTYLPYTTPLTDGATYYVEAANLSDPSAPAFRQSQNRLAVTVDLVDETYTASLTYSALVEASDMTTFTLALEDQPNGTVVYRLSSTAANQMTVSPSTMTFTPSDWNNTQVGTITTVDNLVVDGDRMEQLRIQVDPDLSEGCYSTDVQNFVISIIDDEVAAYTLSTVSGSLSECNSQTAEFTVVLLAEPLTNVIIDLQNADTSELSLATNRLTFSPLNWNVPQSVILSVVDELVVDGTQSVSITAEINASSDTAFTSLEPQVVTVTTSDNDQPGFTVSAIDQSLTEAATQTVSLTLVLDAQPQSDVTISVGSSPTDELTLSGNSYTFTNANWNVTQTLVITSVDDDFIDGTQHTSLSFSIESSSDPFFTSLATQTRTVANQDNDRASFTVGPTNGFLEEGNLATASFTLVLDAQPDINDFVILDVVSSDSTESRIATNSSVITFNHLNWNIPQIITLNSVDDLLIDGTVSSTISIGINPLSPPNDFSNLATQTLTVQTFDNDQAGFTLTPLTGSLTEGSNTRASFGVVLNAQPLTNVYLDLNSSDVGEVTVFAPLTKTFTPATWNVTQTVMLNSVDDVYIDGSQQVSITVAVNTASDNEFIGVASQVVSVTNADNDQASIQLIPNDNLTSEDGDTADFLLQLSAIPSADVTIDIRSSNIAEAVLQTTQVVFTPANWNVPQQIILTGVDDSPPVSDGGQTVTIVTENVRSADPNFDAITDAESPNYQIVNQDNDAPAVLISLLDNNFNTTEFGNTVTVQFELLSAPSSGSTVRIPLSLSGATDEMVLNDMYIDIPSNQWNQPSLNQVVLTGVDDDLLDGTQKVTLVTGDPTSTDLSYDNLSGSQVADIELYNIDDDNTAITSPFGVVSEDNTSTTFSVVLSGSISSTTVIKIINNDPSEIELSEEELFFTPLNWDQPQSVLVFGIDDDIVDGDIYAGVQIAVDRENCDIGYCNVAVQVIQILNLDNDFDADNDTFFDTVDNCPNEANQDQADFDQDGIGDACDDDRDGDGVSNSQEEIDSTNPDDPCSYVFQSISLARLDRGDCDNDSIPNSIDLDDDNDGILDQDEGFMDTDLDGIPNLLDLDTDGDGCYDTVEAGFDDSDGDGLYGLSPIVVDALGRVIGSEDAIPPNDMNANLIHDYKESGTPMVWVIQPSEEFPLSSSIVVSAVLSDPDLALYQWQENKGTMEAPQWENVYDGLVISGSNTPQIRFTNPDGCYGGRTFRLKAENISLRCQGPLYSNSFTLGLAEIIIPNAFSPDNDGINDAWEIQGLPTKKAYRLTVYNRWENKVFETTKYDNDWFGTTNLPAFISGGEALPEGTYFYLLEWEDGTPPLTGFVYIKRRRY